MEAATITQQEETHEPAARVTASKMFRYSTFVDVGDGAEECPHSRDGECKDIEHFHAWVRLPNPYQHEDIRRKALAAKARKLRELRDPESDASIVLDNSIDSLREETRREEVIEDLLANEWGRNYLQAQQDVDGREEYEHIRQDQEEFRRLRGEEEALDERSDEYKRLDAHLTSYAEAVRDRLRELQQPARDDFGRRSIDELADSLRAGRVEDAGNQAFLDAYDPWMWFVGTFKVNLHPTLGRPHLPMWEEIGRRDRPSAGTMFGEAPEVIEKLKLVFDELNVALQRASAGN